MIVFDRSKEEEPAERMNGLGEAPPSYLRNFSVMEPIRFEAVKMPEAAGPNGARRMDPTATIISQGGTISTSASGVDSFLEQGPRVAAQALNRSARFGAVYARMWGTNFSDALLPSRETMALISSYTVRNRRPCSVSVYLALSASKLISRLSVRKWTYSWI